MAYIHISVKYWNSSITLLSNAYQFPRLIFSLIEFLHDSLLDVKHIKLANCMNLCLPVPETGGTVIANHALHILMVDLTHISFSYLVTLHRVTTKIAKRMSIRVPASVRLSAGDGAPSYAWEDCC